MENILFKFQILTLFFYVSSAKVNYEEDINAFLFPKDGKVEFVDLTHAFDKPSENHVALPGEICVSARVNATDLWSYHKAGEKFVGNIPLKNLILPLIIVDISKKVNGDSNFVLQKFHLDYFLNNYFGLTYQPCLIIFKFGWTENYVTDQYRRNMFTYYNVDNVEEITKDNHPGISEDLAKWITRSYKNVVGVGVDTPSVDPGASQEAPAFGALTDAGVYVLENVKLDQYLPEESCTAVVSPLKTSESCSPYRLLAICPQSRMKQREIRMHRI